MIYNVDTNQKKTGVPIWISQNVDFWARNKSYSVVETESIHQKDIKSLNV